MTEKTPVENFTVDRDDEDQDPGEITEFPFTIDEDPTILTARKPKSGWIIRFRREWAATMGREATTLSTDETVALVEEFMVACLDKPSREYLRDRFEDPDDVWDYDYLQPVLERVKTLWFALPTGRPTASSTTPRPRGSRSTVRAPSKG